MASSLRVCGMRLHQPDYIQETHLIRERHQTSDLVRHSKAAIDQVSNGASVLARVIQVPRVSDSSQDGFNELVSQIVAGTNWQNAIGAADLMSNDHKQIVLERELRKLGYLYVRKRQSKAEANLRAGSSQFRHITKEQLAQAVAGCDLDPSIVRSGKDNLFKEELYPQVFPNVDPDYFLPRYWLMKAVTLEAKGYPERGYLKWLILNFMWRQVARLVSTKKRKRYFHQAYYRKAAGFEKPLAKAIDKAFVGGRRFYRKNRGKGAKAEDISRFFRNRRNLHTQFGEFWESPNNTSKKHFETYLKRVEKEISGN